MHPFNLLCPWRHFFYLLTWKFTSFFAQSSNFFFSEGHSLSLPATLDIRNAVFSEDQQDQDNTHRHRVVMSLQGMRNVQTCEGSIRSMRRHITAHCLGSLLYLPCAGHHFALHATAHTSKVTADERLSYTPCAR